jgi:hypothetical protein
LLPQTLKQAMFRQIPTILVLSKPVKMHYLKTPTSKNLE